MYFPRCHHMAHPDLLRQQRPPLAQHQAAVLPGASQTSCKSPAMPNPKTDPATLRAWSPMTQAAAGIQPRLCPTHGDATAGVDREPGTGRERQSVVFGVALDSVMLHLLTLRKQPGRRWDRFTLSKMGPGSAEGSSDFWAATQIVPKVLILLSYRGA